MDESRKAFEQWCKTVMTDDADFCMEWGDYSNLNVRLRWEAWQASRAAIEINLSDIELVTDTLTAPGDGWEVYDAQKTDKAIREAGIKVKE
ncbi:hypothetical protein HB664_19060 [Enterobacter sp. DNB-S2]|uniref:hypothetical protein n=1 Tax=Enterobacter sp. DNB-S2 TaxID=2720029 RepID=UPI001C626C31|nr:hypothetical protein [Enterobacter sp. DNB-S2]QYH18042.1 hypothetical protein HB664_19060 [Enterobacter sp. DNB-S2]